VRGAHSAKANTEDFDGGRKTRSYQQEPLRRWAVIRRRRRLRATQADREASGDPRPSIDELYASKDEYLERVRAASQQLVDEGYLLAEDVDEVAKRAELRFDRFRGAADGS
jgi:phosphoenolpyruvate carboxylase